MSFPVRLVLFALAYGAGAELSYLLLSKTDNAIAFWPPAGIYLAMLLATPRRRWWAVMLAAGIPNLLSDAVIHQHSLMVSVVFLLVNLGAPLVGVAFITRLCRAAFTFERLSHVLIWSIATSLVSAPLSALFGGLTTATVYGGSLRQKMLFWWLGDLLGLLLVTPLVYGLLGWRKWPSQRQGFETAALLLSLSAATTLIFRLPEIFVLPPSVLFFFLLWAALRFGATAVAAAATVLAVISIWLTEAGLGPFSYLLTAPARLLMAQILVVTGALLFYVIAAVMAERRASESEFFNRITDIAPTTLYIYDLNETRNVWINRDVFEVLSYTSTEVRELGAELLATLMHPEDKVQYAAHYEHLRGLPAGEAAEFEYRMRHQDGSWRWFISREMAYARDADGAVSQIVGAATDITANKQAEEALRRSEERFRSLIEATAQITWTNSAAGEMRGGQEQWGAFTGQSFEQYQNYGWADALHPDDRAHTLERWQQSVADRILFEAEHRVRRRDGEYCHCLVRAVPVLNANGEIREWVGIHTDISEEKRLLAAERKARELAEAANRLKDEFLATVSHELRTPLNHMLGWVVMLRTDSLTPEKAAEALATIERNVRAQNRLVEDLLDVSRIVTGKMQLLVQSVVSASARLPAVRTSA